MKNVKTEHMGTKHVGSGNQCREADTGVPVPMCVSAMCGSDVSNPLVLLHSSLSRSSGTAFFLRSLPHVGTGTLVRASPHKLPDPMCFVSVPPHKLPDPTCFGSNYYFCSFTMSR